MEAEAVESEAVEAEVVKPEALKLKIKADSVAVVSTTAFAALRLTLPIFPFA